jgi:predicted ArsR family transcriptional regulator
VKSRISISFEKFLVLLKKRGALSAAAIAQELDMTGEGARFQLVKLEEEGFVQSGKMTKGVGRPIQIWSLTDKGHGYFPDAHSDFSAQLIDNIATALGENAVEAVIRSREKTIVKKYTEQLKGLSDLKEKLKKLVEIRNGEGYLAELQQESGDFLFIENHCPIGTVAGKCSGICKSELNVFVEVLDQDAVVTRTSHLMTGAHHCTYRISPKL